MNRNGMAIIIVLVFSTALLALAGMYVSSSRNATPINSRLLERVQMDFLGQGITQLALLKFKQLPSEFYYAYNFTVRDKRTATPDPWAKYLLGPLKGERTSPFELKYHTNCRVLGQTQYKTDAIEFEVIIEGNDMTRNIKKTINSTRVRN
ncbi:MAG TPA: hypothetical protein DCG57_00275 [Candidatus Riflebacteria bacterium]|nr:hypothetical protein [Candidatus Riflebacteria bacterium]